jgi:TetR/AcrR family transcriptional regulator, mexJK operon transcriptional repressor
MSDIEPTSPAPSGPPAGEGTRAQRKRDAILAAATTVFLDNGYLGASMDDVAARANVSKQTVYKHFQDKEDLFREVILSISAQSARVVERIAQHFANMTDPAEGLRALGRDYLRGVLRPEVLQLRRLIIAEAERFPDIAQAYYQGAPTRGMQAIAEGLDSLTANGRLQIADTHGAASHFAYLVIGPTLDHALFLGPNISAEMIAKNADAGVDAFLTTLGVGGAHAASS